MDNRPTVLITDNSEEFCTTLTAVLQKTNNFQVIGSTTDGEQALRMISQH